MARGFTTRDLESMTTLIGHRLLGTRGTFQKKIKEFLQVPTGDYGYRTLTKSGVLHPLLAMSLKEHLEAEAEVLEITNDWGELTLPLVQTLEVGFGKQAVVVFEGYYFLRYRSIPLVVHVFVDQWSIRDSATAAVYFRSGDDMVAEQFLGGLEERFCRRNFYKGQKLIFVKEQNSHLAKWSLKFLNTEGWAEIQAVLPDSLDLAISENSLGWLCNAEALKRSGLPTKRGLLLYGPPGTGKTLLFKNLCARAEGITCIFISAESLEGPLEVTEVYELARMLRPTLVFLEDLDFIGNDRTLNSYTNKMLGALLAELDGIKGNEEVVTLASTNFPDVIDKALADRPGRFDLKVEITFPGKEERKRMLGHFLGRLRDGVRSEVNEEEIASLAEATNGLSGAHLAEVVTKAASRCLFDRKPVLNTLDLKNSLRTLKEGKEKEIGF